MENNINNAEEVNEVLKSCYDYFYRLIPGMERVVKELYENPGENLSDLADACEGVAWLTLALTRMNDLHKIDIDVEYVKKNQANINQGLENRDFSYIAETLEYEVLPMLRNWFDIIDEEYGYENTSV